jgi:selenocysteine-specific elongation factor
MILGTAGHVDHGKTALVRALTGVDTDRLPEEKRRGITIELGFAPLVLDGTGVVGVVDVPGHESFVRTMLAGATGVDLALLVVASDEGVMPQTREHLAILALLGVSGGVVALTKCDLVDDEWLQLVDADVRSLLTGSSLADCAIVPCSARTGAGLDVLRAALTAAARAVPPRDTDDFVRLPVDRAFSVRGAGSVVTGTLWSGVLTTDSMVRLLPSGVTARVRSLESHGTAVARATPGNRVAVALAGVDRADVARGQVLVQDGDPWSPSTALRADVTLLAGAPTLSVRTRVRFHLGTVDVGARVVAAGGRVEAETARSPVPVRLAFDQPVVARTGDRFVLRSASPAVSIGGGVVTDSSPPGRRAKPWPNAHATADARIGWMVNESGGAGLRMQDLRLRIGGSAPDMRALVARSAAAVRVGERVFPADLRTTISRQLLGMVNARHTEQPLEPGLSLQHAREQLKVHDDLFTDVLNEAVASNLLELVHGVIARRGWQPGSGGADSNELDALSDVLQAAGAQPPSVAELTPRFGPRVTALLRALERQGRAVAVAADRYYAPAALDDLVARLRAGESAGQPRTASQIKETLGLTRKFLIPFLEYCDKAGVTQRFGDARVVRPPK